MPRPSAVRCPLALATACGPCFRQSAQLTAFFAQAGSRLGQGNTLQVPLLPAQAAAVELRAALDMSDTTVRLLGSVAALRGSAAAMALLRRCC